MNKHSKQRDCIQSFLMNRKDHPTAETIYMGIRNDFPKVSLATVYRNLSLLAELGEIQKISTGNGPDRFDGNPVPHSHFSCNICDAMLDLEMDDMEYLNDMASRNFSGSITGHSILFQGLCPDCLQNQAKNHDINS